MKSLMLSADNGLMGGGGGAGVAQSCCSASYSFSHILFNTVNWKTTKCAYFS